MRFDITPLPTLPEPPGLATPNGYRKGRIRREQQSELLRSPRADRVERHRCLNAHAHQRGWHEGLS